MEDERPAHHTIVLPDHRAARSLSPDQTARIEDTPLKIHPQALVSPLANIADNVEIGAFCIVEQGATIGKGSVLANHVVVKSGTTLGERNHVFEGTVLGGLPQHVHLPEHPGSLVIGHDNIIRENATVHLSLDKDGTTLIGDKCLLMVGTHIAHDCTVGDGVILTNNVLLAGHVEVAERAYLGGASAVHQFCRIGRLAMIGGMARVKKDVPPFVLVDDATSLIVGLNKIGLRRGGFASEEIEQLKDAYRLIYRRGLTWNEILDALKHEFPEGRAAEFHEFFCGGTRGFVPERRTPPAATLRLHRDGDAESRDENASPDYRSKAG